MSEQADEKDLIIKALQERIGEMAINYESQIVSIKLQARREVDELVKSLQEKAGEE